MGSIYVKNRASVLGDKVSLIPSNLSPNGTDCGSKRPGPGADEVVERSPSRESPGALVPCHRHGFFCTSASAGW